MTDLSSDRVHQKIFGYLLPIARAGTTITYGEISAKLTADVRIDVFSTHIGHAVGSLMTRILRVDESAPLINILVVNKRTGQPGSGADGFLRERFLLPNERAISRRRELVAKAAEAVYNFRGWSELYQRLFKHDAPPADPSSLIRGEEQDGSPPESSQAGPHFGGPAESEEHRKLKEYVLRNPGKIGAGRSPDDARKEYMLLSGDKVDVYFARRDAAYLVEVKSVRSTEPDLRRGIFQSIKYRAVFQAQRLETTPDVRVEAVLVVEHEPQSYIRDLAKRHKVKVVVLTVNG